MIAFEQPPLAARDTVALAVDGEGGRMTAGTVVITGGILATVILLCIIAVLCYCRLQYYCCRKEEPEEEEEPDFDGHAGLPPLHCNRNLVLTNGPALRPGAAAPFGPPSPQARALCRSCSHFEPPTFFLQEPEDEGVPNGGERVAYRTLSQEDLALPPETFGGLQALNPNRLSAMREAFSRSRSFSTDV